jgi:hypothetical protein
MEIKGVSNSDTAGALLDAGLSKSAVPPQAKGLGNLLTGAGRAVLSSSTGDQKSYILRDRTLSIFTHHLVEALSGHAEPKEGATEVLVSDVMGYVSRNVPKSAADAYQVDQVPVFQLSGENFPVALLLGGKGLAKGELPPPPLQPSPLSPSTDSGQAPQPSIDTGGGAYIGGSVQTGGGAFTGHDRITHGDAIQGSQFNMSGNFSGAILNIQSRLENVTQSIGALPHGDNVQKADLFQLIAGLETELRKAPPDRAADAEAVAKRLDALVSEIQDDNPDQDMVSTWSDQLRKAAARLGDVLPPILSIAADIAALVGQIIPRGG